MTLEAQIRTVQRSHIWDDTLTMISTIRDSDDARLDNRCPWRSTSIITTLQRAHTLLTGMPQELQFAAQTGNNNKFRELLQRQGGGRATVILSVLTARARRWSLRPNEIVEAVLRFSRKDPPPELITSALRALLYAWCTSARFAQEVKPCYFCKEADKTASSTTWLARFCVGGGANDSGLRRSPPISTCTVGSLTF